ncbi:MAG: HAMP domain-containing histidine kinase [Cyclobacteriaceae bacterium]|nr:HAMP domain-containing histidine kinase [Cyclobacteriaceae bacterium]
MTGFFNSLFWRISFLFLLILLIISGIYIYISLNTAEMYFQETRQNLDIEIAAHIAAENDCFQGDSANLNVLKNVFHDVMVINPSIEVYLLDTAGRILAYYAPNQKITTEKVPLNPIKEFISDKKNDFLLGMDPKNPGKKKTFSAARVIEEKQFKGYIYVILGGQEYENASQMILGSYILRLGIRSMIIASIAAVIIGFIAIGFIVRNIRQIVQVIYDFRGGNLQARIHLKSKSELQEFADSFNDMADTIVRNFDDLKKLDKNRRELAANISHDLRTPLTIIRGYAETIQLKNNRLSSKKRNEYLETMVENIDRMLKMVHELFELSNLEASDAGPDREIFSLAELLHDIKQKNQIIADVKKIKLFLECNGQILPVYADIQMMEKVIQNLLDNAFNYTDPGGEICLSLAMTNDHNILITIRDTGIGIEEEQLPRIFDRYYRVKSESDERNGTGLGLAIVNKIIELHGFKISVKSTVNRGTIFSIIIPPQPVPEEQIR